MEQSDPTAGNGPADQHPGPGPESGEDQDETVFAAARHLSETEREILYLHLGKGLSRAEIASRVGLSRWRVSRLLRRSLDRLGDPGLGRPRAPSDEDHRA